MAAVVGAGFVAWSYSDIQPVTFIDRLHEAVWLQTVMVGFIKAPFMAMIIGLIACVEGMRVQGSAESLGKHVTRAVVKTIFMVIVMDGLFAIFFAAINY
jgi:phospholipid/cholesterol/gamma-HCH transport system permease protein